MNAEKLDDCTMEKKPSVEYQLWDESLSTWGYDTEGGKQSYLHYTAAYWLMYFVCKNNNFENR